MGEFDTLAKINGRYMGTRSTQSKKQAATYYFRIDVGAGSIREARTMEKDICETCIYNKYNCMYMMGGNVKADFEREIIIECDRYEDEAGGSKVYGYNADVVNFDVAVNLMDDDIRESVHRDLAPCTNQEFFNEYCERHLAKYGTEFVYN